MNDEEWAAKAHDIAIDLVMNVKWPWTERQKRLWYIGVLAGTVSKINLLSATMTELQEYHRELSK